MLVTNEEIDEILESIWCGKEIGSVKRNDLLKIKEAEVTPEIIEKLIDEDYIFDVGGEINLTQKGEEIAKRLIRAHRLAERLFTDVMVIEDESTPLYVSRTCNKIVGVPSVVYVLSAGSGFDATGAPVSTVNDHE